MDLEQGMLFVKTMEETMLLFFQCMKTGITEYQSMLIQTRALITAAYSWS